MSVFSGDLAGGSRAAGPGDLLAGPALKAHWRSEFRRRRMELGEAERARRSAAIRERLAALPELRTARTVLGYWPLLHRGEIDLRPLLRRLAGVGARVALPVLTPGGERLPEAGRMECRFFSDEITLVPNPWGVLEPPPGARVPPAEIDVVIAPALGADRRGYRIGYGKGHYDEFLSDFRGTVVCAVYDECLVPRLPSEPHDVPADILVTEGDTLPLRRR